MSLLQTLPTRARGEARDRRGVVVNGKFLSAAPTGVHRVAAELITAADRLRAERGDPRPWRLSAPRDADLRLQLATISQRKVGLTTWQPWEQLDLPIAARSSLLLNLCNLGPLAHPASIVMMHDAQVFSSPDSYGARFRMLYEQLQPRLGRRALRVLTVSEFSRQQLAHYGVAPIGKIDVVPNGCDHLLGVQPSPSLITELGLERKGFVLALANTQSHKNIGLLLKAFAHRALADLRLVLVGKADRAAFEAAGHVAPPNTVFAGAVSDGGFRALYEAALCLAFPSRTEGFGLPPLEAMSLGCPVVAAPCGALPEVCGSAALYAEPDDPEAWAKAVSLCAGGDERARRVDLGRAQAARFTWRASAAALLEVVSRV